MRRIALLIEMTDDEADQVVDAVSATQVRFGGLALAEVLNLLKADAPALGTDAIIRHDLCSDGALYAGGPMFSLVKL